MISSKTLFWIKRDLYSIDGLVSKGGDGEIYRARKCTQGDCPNILILKSNKYSEQHLREIMCLQNLKHKNICSLFNHISEHNCIMFPEYKCTLRDIVMKSQTFNSVAWWNH